MLITWHNGSTIKLTQKKISAALNPVSTNLEKDVRIAIYDKTDGKHIAQEEILMVDWPGEYDRAGFVFRGIESMTKHPVIAYTFFTQDGNIAWMGEMAEYPSEEFIESLGEVHVLILPVGGKDVLSVKDAFKLVEELEPLVVIPMCFGEKREGLALFLKEMDVKMRQAVKSYDLKKSALNQENMELVILEPHS